MWHCTGGIRGRSWSPVPTGGCRNAPTWKRLCSAPVSLLSPGRGSGHNCHEHNQHPDPGFQMPIRNLQNQRPWRDTDARAWAGKVRDEPASSLYGKAESAQTEKAQVRRSEEMKNQAGRTRCSPHWFFQVATLTGVRQYLIVGLSRISLMMSDGSIFSCAYGHFYVFPGQMSVRVLCPFLNWVVSLNPLSDT